MKKKKILILGTTGMLGNTLFRYLILQNTYVVYGLIRDRKDKNLFDIRYEKNLINLSSIDSYENLIKIIKKLKPDIIINSIGVVKQQINENKTYETIKLNALFPHELSKISNNNKCRLIHISTDCVYDGMKGSYSEFDSPNATDLYGKSKALGEINYPNTLTIRTSYIGHEIKTPHGLLNWFLSQKRSVLGFKKAMYNGLTTLELSKVISGYVLPNTKLQGLYNVSSKPISKYDLLCIIADQYNKIIKIKKNGKVKIDRTLNSKKFQKKTGYKIFPWTKMIKEMYDFK